VGLRGDTERLPGIQMSVEVLSRCRESAMTSSKPKRETHDDGDGSIDAREGAKDGEHNRVVSSHGNQARVLFSIFGEAVDLANLGFGRDGAREQRVVGDIELVDGEGGVVGGPVVVLLSECQG
jgi:hypothetical protein